MTGVRGRRFVTILFSLAALSGDGRRVVVIREVPGGAELRVQEVEALLAGR